MGGVAGITNMDWHQFIEEVVTFCEGIADKGSTLCAEGANELSAEIWLDVGGRRYRIFITGEI